MKKIKILTALLLMLCSSAAISCRDTRSSDDSQRVENDESTPGSGTIGNATGANSEASRPEEAGESQKDSAQTGHNH